jgi:pimeloyl-ACP methyl ester carboxylesterase
VPSLVVGGEGDIFKPEVFTTIAEALPKAELKIVKGHDHISYIVDTDIFYPELIDFFNK